MLISIKRQRGLKNQSLKSQQQSVTRKTTLRLLTKLALVITTRPLMELVAISKRKKNLK